MFTVKCTVSLSEAAGLPAHNTTVQVCVFLNVPSIAKMKGTRTQVAGLVVCLRPEGVVLLTRLVNNTSNGPEIAFEAEHNQLWMEQQQQTRTSKR